MPDYRLRLIVATDDPTHSRLYVGYDSIKTQSIYGQVRDDQQIALSIEPVVSAPLGSDSLFLSDADAADTYEVGIGVADQPPTSGTFELTVAGSTTGMTALPFDVNAASLQTVISAAMVAGGKPACTVTAVGTLGGAFAINATANGAIPTGTITSDASNLFPNCDVAINEISLGSAGTKYQIILALRQQPHVLAFPSTLLPATVLSVDITQVASAVLNAVNTVEFTVAPVGGSFAVAAYANGISRAVGVILASASALEFQTLLETFAPLLNNVNVVKVGSDFVVSFIKQCAPQNIIASSVAASTEITTEHDHGFVTGMTVNHTGTNSTPNTNGTHVITVTASNKYTIAVNVTVAGTAGVTRDNTDPVLSATDVNLISPQGVSGVINNNTINFWQASQLVDGEYFDAFIAIRRTRSSGEKRVIFFSAIQLSKDIFDTDTLVPLTFPSYFTAAQSDARYGQLAITNSWDDTQTIDLTGVPASFGLFIKEDVAQVGDLIRVEDSVGNILFNVSPSGDVLAAGGFLANGNMSITGSAALNGQVLIGSGGGANTSSGTFTLVAGTKNVGNTSITANSVVLVTLKTVGGVRAGNPDIVCTAGVGFVATGAGTDTSTYNYVIIEKN